MTKPKKKSNTPKFVDPASFISFLLYLNACTEAVCHVIKESRKTNLEEVWKTSPDADWNYWLLLILFPKKEDVITTAHCEVTDKAMADFYKVFPGTIFAQPQQVWVNKRTSYLFTLKYPWSKVSSAVRAHPVYKKLHDVKISSFKEHKW